MSMDFVNKIFCGDCQNVMRQQIPSGTIDLIYADPPFFTEKKYEVIWGNGYEVRAYEDRWKGGVQNFLAWIEPKLGECRRVLKATGSMYLHCDWHVNAHLRILMDRIFGEQNFQNEVIWHYRTGGVGKRWFGRKHDTILVFSKKISRVKFSPQEVKEYYRDIYGSEFKPGWKDRRGGTDSKGAYRYAFMDDVWDIPAVFNMSKEYLGYPTQKPEALLERIIDASSDSMDIVLDPFCGCGTTLVVAYKLGRRFVGIDISPTACKLMFKRLRKINPSIKLNETVIGLPKTLEEIRRLQPFEFQNWVIQKLGARMSERKIGDMGIDGFTFDLKPIQVKQSDKVGRNVVDNFETAMRRVKAKKGIIVAFSFGKGAYEEVARAKLQEGLEIELITASDLTEKYS